MEYACCLQEIIEFSIDVENNQW